MNISINILQNFHDLKIKWIGNLRSDSTFVKTHCKVVQDKHIIGMFKRVTNTEKFTGLIISFMK